jgi:hypothetical protein
MEPTHPDRWVENVTAPSAGGFPDPDGEDSRRERRGGRGAGTSTSRSTSRSRSTGTRKTMPADTGYLKKALRNIGGRAWNLPTPIGRSKTSPRPLREALRIRMGKPLPFRTTLRSRLNIVVMDVPRWLVLKLDCCWVAGGSWLAVGIVYWGAVLARRRSTRWPAVVRSSRLYWIAPFSSAPPPWPVRSRMAYF